MATNEITGMKQHRFISVESVDPLEPLTLDIGDAASSDRSTVDEMSDYEMNDLIVGIGYAHDCVALTPDANIERVFRFALCAAACVWLAGVAQVVLQAP